MSVPVERAELPEGPQGKPADALAWQSPEPAPEPLANDDQMQNFLGHVRQSSLARNQSASYQFRVTTLFIVMLMVAATMNVVRQYHPEVVLRAYLFLVAWAPLVALVVICWLPQATLRAVAVVIVLTVFVSFAAPVLMFGDEAAAGLPCVLMWWVLQGAAFAWAYGAQD